MTGYDVGSLFLLAQKRARTAEAERDAARAEVAELRQALRVAQVAGEAEAVEHVELRAQVEAVRAQRDKIARRARVVMNTLAEYGPGIAAHLMDTDDNPGERLRQAVADALDAGDRR